MESQLQSTPIEFATDREVTPEPISWQDHARKLEEGKITPSKATDRCYKQMYKGVAYSWNEYLHLRRSDLAYATLPLQRRSIICNAIKDQAYEMNKADRHESSGSILGMPLDELIDIDVTDREQVATYQTSIEYLTDCLNYKLAEDHHDRVEHLRRQNPYISYSVEPEEYTLPTIKADLPPEKVSSQLNHCVTRLISRLNTLGYAVERPLDGFADYIEEYIEEHIDANSETADVEIQKLLQLFENMQPGTQQAISRTASRFAQERARLYLVGEDLGRMEAAENKLERR